MLGRLSLLRGTVCAFLFLLVFHTHATAGRFLTAPHYAVTHEPSSVAVGDFNNDGKLDLVTTDYGVSGNRKTIGNTVSVLLGNGDGTFQPAVDYPAGGNFPTQVVVGDFNSDGKLDLVVETASATSLLLGNGDGTFGAPVRINLGGPGPLVVGDFNGDGNLDLAVGTVSVLSVALGNGDGTFQAPKAVATGNFLSLATGDFNGDHKLDFAVIVGVINGCCEQFHAATLLGNGDGTFQAPAIDKVQGSFVTIGDFNGDGKLDLGVISDGTFDVLFGNGDGTFQGEKSFTTGDFTVFALAADLDSDGTADLALVNSIEGDVSVFVARRDNSFDSAVNFGAGAYPVWAAVGDFNGDHKPDLAVADSVGKAVTVLLGRGDGTFSAPHDFSTGAISPVSAALGNFGSSLEQGLAVVNSQSVGVLVSNGDGTLQPAVNYAVQNLATSVAIGDLNGDGVTDLAVTNACGADNGCGSPGGVGTVSVLLGNADGTFQPAVNYPVAGAAQSVAVADFNHDGKLDLAVSNSCIGGVCGSSDTVSILLGNGDGTFQSAVNYQVSPSPGSIAVADFNGDGNPDVVTVGSDTSFGAAVISVLLGNGDGTFRTALQKTVQGAPPYSLTTADFNGDGKPDLALTTRSPVSGRSHDGSLTILLGDGSGRFQKAEQYSVGSTPESIGAADFNGDGKLDLVVSNDPCCGNSGSLSLLLGNGDGTFQPAVDYNAGSGPISVVVADLNGDGAPDVAVIDKLSYIFDGIVSVLLNTGGTAVSTTSSANPSTFGQPVTFTTIVKLTVRGAGTPTGSVTFKDGTTTLGTAPLVSGVAGFTTSSLAKGTHTITAFYSGDANFNSHTAPPIVQTVQ